MQILSARTKSAKQYLSNLFLQKQQNYDLLSQEALRK